MVSRAAKKIREVEVLSRSDMNVLRARKDAEVGKFL